jgi:hypothetical protein
VTINHLGDLRPDKNNARRHNPRNISMVETSLQADGFGRSILLDAGGNIIAGNGVTEAAGNVGLEDVLIVPSDGTRVIAIQRTDVQPGSERAVRLAIADNRTTDLSDFDPAVVAALADEVDLSDFWRDDELDALLAGMPGDDQWATALGGLPDGEKSPFQQMTFTVSNAQAETINAALSRAKALAPFDASENENSNGNALARVCESFVG